MEADDIIKMIAALGLGGWVSTAVKEYFSGRNSSNLKKIEHDASIINKDNEIEDLKKETSRLLENIIILKNELDKYQTLLKETEFEKMKIQQQLATINIAFDIIYAQLKNIFGNDKEHADLLNQLKGYIDNGTKHM